MTWNSTFVGLLLTLLWSCNRPSEEVSPVRKNVVETVFASGVLEADGTYNLTAKTDGYLKEVTIQEGEEVAAGKLLAVVDNMENMYNKQSTEDLYNIANSNTLPKAPALLTAKNNITTAQQQLQRDSVQKERYLRLLNNNSIAKNEYETVSLQYYNSVAAYHNAIENYKQTQQLAEQQLVSSRAQNRVASLALYHNQIKAVVGGKVLKQYKQAGDYVKQGDVIAQIGNANFIYAKVNIDETNIGRVALGQRAQLALNTKKDRVYEGKVIDILPLFDESSQSFIAKIAFTDSLDFRIINTRLEANIVVDSQHNAVLIPRRFVDFGGYVQVKGEKQKRKITTRFSSNEWVQVLSGIPDDVVLVAEKKQHSNLK